MRKLILFVLVFVSFKASAQWTIINGKQRFAQGLGIPVKDTIATLLSDSAQIVLRPQDSAIYYKYKGKWQKATGSGTTPNLQQVTNVDSTTNRVVSVRELNLLDVDGSGSYDLNLKGENMGLTITDKNAEPILKINGTGVGTPKLYFGESGASATLIPAGSNPQLNLPSINGTLALISDITYPDTTVIATHTYVDSSTKTKIDSLKRSTDSVFAFKNGAWVFQYKDTLRYDTATVILAYVSNADTGTLQRGEVVYLFGATGDRASVKRANNKSDTTSSKTFAIVRDPITQGNAGWVVTQGQCGKLNLSAYNEGDILWLDSIAGQMTKTKPQAPYHQVFVGVVERANAGNGLFYVKPANGFELGELHNVQVNSQNNNDVLYYDSVPKLWKAKSAYLLVDTSNLSTRIDARVKYTDTATMLTPYLRKIDTASLSNRINAKFTLPTLTNGSVLFSNGTTISQNNTRLFWDNTNNRLGVGTSSPSTPLHVNATLSASGALARLGLVNGTLTATANNDVLVGLDISPTFSNGAFTGVGNYPLRLGGHIGIGTANAFGFNYANFNALTSNNGIAANFTPNGTPTGLPYVFQFNKTSGTTNVNALLFVGGGSAGTGNSANKHVISSTADGTATSQPIVIRAASTGTNWGSVNDHLTVFATGNVVVQNASASATDAGFRFDVNGTGRFQSTLTTAGNMVGYTSKTGAYTATGTDEIIVGDATAGAFTITLPTAVGRTGQRYTIKKTDSGINVVTVGTTSSQTIDGSTTYLLATQWKYVTVVSNGANWIIISNN